MKILSLYGWILFIALRTSRHHLLGLIISSSTVTAKSKWDCSPLCWFSDARA